MKKTTLFNYILSTILVMGVISALNAQLQNSNWYFGDQAALNFPDVTGTLPPTILTNNAMSTTGSSTSVSDSAGNLLFYSDGITVWNKNHQVMPNGTGLFGNQAVSQSVVIVPNPEGSNFYYIFSNEGNIMGISGIYYSEIDMNLDGGLGDVETARKNTLLREYTGERMTVIQNPNENSYWLVIFAPDNDPTITNTFYSYKIDANGITLANTSTFTFPYPESQSKLGGQMKISPDAQSLAMVFNTSNIDQLGNIQAKSLYTFDFNNSTGEVTGMNSTFGLEADVLYSYGIEFSPDSNLLYVSVTDNIIFGSPDSEGATGRVYQIEYRNTLHPTPTLLFDDRNPVYGLQLGIDGKIYAANSSGTLSTINNPVIVGLGANYVVDSFDFFPNATSKEMPQLSPDVFLSQKTAVLPKKPVIQGNPFKEELKFKFKFIQDYTIQFYNSMGVLSKVFVYDNMTNRKILKVDTSDLAPDTYYLTILDEHSQVWYETVLRIQ